MAVWSQPLPDGCAIQTKTLNKKALRTWIVDGQDFDNSGLSIAEYIQQGPQFYTETNLLWVDNIINDGSFAYDQNLFRVRGWSDERLIDVDMFGEEWDRTHYNVNPLSFFLGLTAICITRKIIGMNFHLLAVFPQLAVALFA